MLGYQSEPRLGGAAPQAKIDQSERLPTTTRAGSPARRLAEREAWPTNHPQLSNMLIQMGLDTVEIVLRIEETFSIDLPDDECGRINTVGDLYRLVLGKLELPYVNANEIEVGRSGCDRSHLRNPGPSSWSSPDVWLTIKGIVVDQLQVKEEDVKEEASLLRDLGCD